MTNRMLDRQELADHFRVSVATVDRWIRDGVPCMKPSTRVVRFDLAEVLEWAKAGKAESKAAI